MNALLPVEGHGGGLDLPLLKFNLDMSGRAKYVGQRQAYLDINLVSAEYNRNIFTNTLEIAMPVGDVLIGDARRDVKHYDTTLALDVIAIAKTTKLFLAGGIPDVENDRAKVGGEG